MKRDIHPQGERHGNMKAEIRVMHTRQAMLKTAITALEAKRKAWYGPNFKNDRRNQLKHLDLKLVA